MPTRHDPRVWTTAGQPAADPLDGVMRAPAWMRDAPCAQTDPEAFFPEKGESTSAAKAVCRNCDVRAECLQYAIDNKELFGVWGGLSERERRALVRGQGRPHHACGCGAPIYRKTQRFCSRRCAAKAQRQRERAA